jgi:hypothetical protein
MKQHINTLIAKYRTKGVLLDANLLLVWCIGAVEPQFIPQCKRTRAYIPDDFRLLSALLRSFTTHVTTPNILTEVSNLANSLHGAYATRFRQIFGQLIPTLSEEYYQSTAVAQRIEFFQFGLTDAGIAAYAKDQYLVVTDDFPLSQFLLSQGIDVLNFNHIRSVHWKSSE